MTRTYSSLQLKLTAKWVLGWTPNINAIVPYHHAFLASQGYVITRELGETSYLITHTRTELVEGREVRITESLEVPASNVRGAVLAEVKREPVQQAKGKK